MTDTFTTENTSDGLLVRNYPVIGHMKAGEHPQVDIDLDNAYLDGQKALFETLKADGKLPRFAASHAAGADVWGRVVDYKRAGEWSNLDILITNPEAQAKFNRGEIPSLSAELVPSADYPLLWAVAATGKDQAQFDIGKPDFMPKEVAERLAKLGKKTSAVAVTSKAKLAFKPEGGDPKSSAKPKQEMPKTGIDGDGSGRMKPEDGRTAPEEVLEAQNKIIGELVSRVDNLEKERMATNVASTEDEEPVESEEDEEMGEPDEGMKGKAMAEEKKPAQFDASVELAKLSRELKIRDKTDEVKEAGCPLKTSEIKAKLSAAKTDAELEVEVAKLSKMPASVDDTDGEKTEGKPSNVKKVLAEARAYFEKYQKTASSGENGRIYALRSMRAEKPELAEAYEAHLKSMTPLVQA